MIKIWAKVLSKEKVIKSLTVSIDEHNTTFFDMLKNVSNGLNIPTPVLLKKHVYDFNSFHMCTFRSEDFVEEVIFDKFILQLMN